MTANSQRSRLNPGRGDANYLVLRILAAQLRREIQGNLLRNASARVADIGCGSRPYEPLFDGYAAEYVGVDYAEGRGVDVVAPAESLPLEDGSFDCVISSQVIEHVARPDLAVAEIRRILKPGGLALVSTHGVIRYHPNPEDYWRWTHAGLAELFRSTGEWSGLTVLPNGSTPVAIGYLVAYESSWLAGKLGFLGKAWRVPIAAMHAVTWRLDRLYRRKMGDRPAPLAANYLVSARR